MVLLTVGTSFPVLLASVLLLGAGQGGVGGPLVSLLGDLTADDRMGRATGTYDALGDPGASVGLLVSPPLAGVVGLPSLYRLTALVPVLAATAVLVGLYTTYDEIPGVTSG